MLASSLSGTRSFDPRSLPTRWQTKAKELRQLGAEPTAKVLERCAADLEEAYRDWNLQPLTLQEAAKESGYSTDHLGRLVRDGTIPNAGEKHSPRIRRGDLPRKPGHRSANGSKPPAPIRSRTEMARSVVESSQGGHDG